MNGTRKQLSYIPTIFFFLLRLLDFIHSHQTYIYIYIYISNPLQINNKSEISNNFMIFDEIEDPRSRALIYLLTYIRYREESHRRIDIFFQGC